MKLKIDYYRTKWNGSSFGAVLRHHPRRTEWALVSLFFAALAALFMGPILWHFTSAVHGFWGDGTGGLIWLNSLHLGPFGGASNAIIYPYGDNLFKPEFITAALFVLPFWLLTQVMGAVAAWNTIIFASFWLCGVSMYYLAKRISRSRLAALWAGVAFAYLPMHQYKAFGHIAYVMTFVFVLVFWHVLNFMEKPGKKQAIFLGLAFAAPFYIDGYYVLFSLLVVGIPLVYMLVRSFWTLNKKTAAEFKQFLLSLVIFIGTSSVALLPVIYTKLVYGAQIASNLAMARGDFMSNVMVYTARWYEFLVPIETHPVFGHWVTAFRLTHSHGSNTSEDTLYVGFAVLSLAAWTGYYIWKQRNAKKLRELPARRQTLLVLALIAFIAFLISLPPYVHLMGHRLPLPSGVISVFVQYWRVYARLVLVIQMMLVLIGAVGLAILLKRARSRTMAIGITMVLIVVTLFEYLSFNPFHRQDIWYYSKLSSANQWLIRHKEIKVIAVYPLVDQPDGLASLYTTEQRVNGKKMINSGTVSTKNTRLRASITGLNDPQTLGVLKALGAQIVMTHEIPNDRAVPGLTLAYGANEAPAGYAADVDLFRIADNVPAATYALLADEGFKDVRETTLKTRYYLNGSAAGASLKIMAMPGVKEQLQALHHVAFDLQTTDSYEANDVVVVQGSKVIDVFHLDPNQTTTKGYDVQESLPVRLVPVGTVKPSSFYLQNLRVEN